ncbi:OmpA family protein [Haliangium sp.]|uniref:OmpA family protein n=1 Tax=Haliangium sp. TaxID=2663208 RepID=UPI003D09F049
MKLLYYVKRVVPLLCLIPVGACLERGEVLHYEAQEHAARAGTEQCYVASDGSDSLLVVDKNDSDPNTNTDVVGTINVADIEAIAIDPITERLYAANANQLGTLNVDTAFFTPTSQPFGSGSGQIGGVTTDVTFDDVDGLAFDPATAVLFGVARRDPGNDVLIMIDKDTGAAIANAFGAGIDYLEIEAPAPDDAIVNDVDDIAIDIDGTFYAVTNEGGDPTVQYRLVTVNKLTGVATVVGATNVADLEGLGFDTAGQLWATGGDTSPFGEDLFLIDKTTGVASSPVTLGSGSDFEGLDCLVSQDSDNDGIGDLGEDLLGSDPNDPDTDDDGIIDGNEPDFDRDTDGDGLPNLRDPDSDNDGVRDGTEIGLTEPQNPAETDISKGNFVPDADPNTTTDPLDPDSDNGGVSDGSEDTDKNGRVDPGETDPTAGNGGDDPAQPNDSDGDGLTDEEEQIEGSDPNDRDTDDDGVLDGDEHNWNLDTDDDGLINVLDPDSDNEGLTDGLERGVTEAERDDDTDLGAGNFVPDTDDSETTSQLNPDTDEGGVTDFAEDPDGDGAVDGGERDPNFIFDDNPGPPDDDNDGLSNAEEMTIGSDPNDADTDDDGVIDGDENNPSVDTDGDGSINVLDPDSDGDGLPDGLERGVTEDTRHPDTDLGAGEFIPDLDPTTTTRDLLPDTDHGGVNDGDEDSIPNGRIDPGEIDPLDPADDGTPLDPDEDGLSNAEEMAAGTDPNDADSDDDGVIDGDEPDWNRDTDGDGDIDALDPDSDNDMIFDGTEIGVTEPHPDTDTGAGNFVPDEDPSTTTDPLEADTDMGGVNDGVEDSNHNGRIDAGETDPNNPADDNPAADRDNDGVPDGIDNCPDNPNPDQSDVDGDGRGDVCDNGPGADDWRVVGGGCAAGGNEAGLGGILLLLVLAWGIRRRRALSAARAVAAALVALCVFAGATGVARAQTVIETDFTLERFRLSGDRQGVLDIEWGQTMPRGTWDFGLWLGTSDDPLVIVRDSDNERLGRLVDHRVGGQLVGALALLDWAQLGVELPVIVSQDQSLRDSSPLMPTSSLSRFGLGDLRLVPKIQVLRTAKHGADLALIPALSLPTSTSDEYFGESGVTFAPELALSRAFGAMRVASNLGYRVRKDRTLADLDVADELFWRLGAGYRFSETGGPPLELDLSLSTATSVDNLLGSSSTNHVELLSGLQYLFSNQLLGILAGGVGINRGFGTPDWRLLIGARFGVGERSAPLVVDSDGDGLPDDEDACPHEAETVNDYQDQDGCPDELDSDGDGLADAVDQCPQEPEDVDAFQDEDGCPDLDSDGDGLDDAKDPCPQEPEDVDGFEDDNGCPDPDNDGDTVLDVDDACINEPGVVAQRGCPDPDRDGDTVVDRLDNCPDEAGDPANNGCEKKQLVAITDDKIELIDNVYFRTNRDVIQPRSYQLLQNVAGVLISHPQVRIRIEGHTDDRGRDAYNKALSQRRANAVRAFLIKEGVAADRLEAIGYGEERPIATNDTPEGRATNRRVDFNIISGADGNAIEQQRSGPGADTIDN